jgi:hypothetical protein
MGGIALSGTDCDLEVADTIRAAFDAAGLGHLYVEVLTAWIPRAVEQIAGRRAKDDR